MKGKIEVDKAEFLKILNLLPELKEWQINYKRNYEIDGVQAGQFTASDNNGHYSLEMNLYHSNFRALLFCDDYILIYDNTPRGLYEDDGIILDFWSRLMSFENDTREEIINSIIDKRQK